MASPEIININDLLLPITEDSPCGSDIREDSSVNSIYYTIKDARNSARAAERQNMFEGNSSEADEHWRKILDVAPEILTSHAKDLEVACWYIESLVRRYGYKGLRDGFTLIKGLVEQYWEGLYPLPDEEGMENRVAPLTGLNGEGAEGVLIAPIRNISITEGQEPYTLWQYQQVLEINKIPDEETRLERVAKNGFGLDDFEKAVNDSSDEFFINQHDDVAKTLEEFKAIVQILDKHCGAHDSPPSSNINNILSESLRVIKHIGKHKLPVETELSEAGNSNNTDENNNEAGGTVITGPIQNREAAFRQISEIAAFFRKTEPHSPISYILERSLKWGNMPLADLMRELIPDSSSLDHYSSITGIKTDDNS